jgi:hypothetical protein
MPNAEVQELIAAVAKKHKLVLGVDDPVLVTVTLNELLLARYIDKIDAKLDAAEARMVAHGNQQIDIAKTIATKIVTGAGDYIADRVKAAAVDLNKPNNEPIDKQLAGLENVAHRANRMAWIAILMSIIPLSLTVGIGIGYWLSH